MAEKSPMDYVLEARADARAALIADIAVYLTQYEDNAVWESTPTEVATVIVDRYVNSGCYQGGA